MNSIILDKKEAFASKVVCIGRNYVDHILELNNEVPKEMVFFNKVNSCISDEIVLPKNNEKCHYEAEISFILEGNKIVALGFGLDLTLREVQSKLKAKGLPWERAKSFNNSAVFSQFVSFDGNIDDIVLELYINDELTQKASVDLMINKPSQIIKEYLEFSSFEDGDILMTGTPKGVGVINASDKFVGKISYQGKLLIQKEFIIK